MKRYFFRLSYLWVLLAMPLAAETVRIYVANVAGTTFSVIDPATNKVVQKIENIEVPEVARFSPDGSRIYITTSKDNFLRVMDRKSGKYIKEVPLSGKAAARFIEINDVAATSDGKLVLVCVRNAGYTVDNIKMGALDIIDAASLERVKTIPVKQGLHDIVLTGDSKYAFAGSSEGMNAIVVDLRSKQIAWEVHFDERVHTMAMENNPDGSGRRVFVSLGDMNGFAVVDFAKRAEVARIEYPELSKFNRTHGSGAHGIEVAPDGKTLWSDSRAANAVFVYSLPELKLLGHFPLAVREVPGHPPLGAQMNWLTFTPDSKTVYLTNERLNSVSAVDVKTRKEVARIPVGEVPHRISTMVAP